MLCKRGMLSGDQIWSEMCAGNISIFPYDKSRLTPLGYNLTASDFVFSTTQKMLLEVKSNDSEKYVEIPAGDTALVLTREYVSVSSIIAGTFHSRVRTVSSGFGHISTTLDPEWKGPLLIAVNNPSNQKRKLVIRSQTGKGVKYTEFVTMMLQYIPANNDLKHDNLPFRFDILEQYYLANPWSKKATNRKTIFFHQMLDIIRNAVDKVNWDVENAVRYKELNEYLEEKLVAFYKEKDFETLKLQIQALEHIFAEVQSYASEIFCIQYKHLVDLAAGRIPIEDIRNSDSEATQLIAAIDVLEQQCYSEVQMIRWKNALSQLEASFDAYRLGVVSAWVVWYRTHKWQLIILLALLVISGAFVYAALTRSEPVYSSIASASCAAAISVLISLFTVRKNQ
jgi:deoxycytidine triphosphate deaminase